MAADINSRTVKVMADYFCDPLWEIDSSGVVNIDPRSLPISRNLALDLKEWSQRYDATLNKSDPLESGFPNAVAHQQFIDDGWILATKLAAELGEGWQVLYFDDLTGKTRDN